MNNSRVNNSVVISSKVKNSIVDNSVALSSKVKNSIAISSVVSSFSSDFSLLEFGSLEFGSEEFDSQSALVTIVIDLRLLTILDVTL